MADLSAVDHHASAIEHPAMLHRVPFALMLGLIPLMVAPSMLGARDSGRINRLDESLPFSGYVVDQAHLLSDAEERVLTERLGRFQRETGHQMAVATVTSLHGEDIARFSLRLAQRWGVGRRHFNDGILILVAPHERKARIEVGLGLERVLPNGACQDVMDHTMMPSFRKGAWGEGIAAGAEAIIDRLAVAERKIAA